MKIATKTTMDEPELTAAKILKSIGSALKEPYLGCPESLFARLNGLWPGLINMGTRSQNRVARGFAKP